MKGKIEYEDVVWYEDCEYEVMRDNDNWAIILIVNHFNNWMCYDVQMPDGATFGLLEPDIYKAIDFLNMKKEEYEKGKLL
jgi:hypothetical protein